MLWEFAKDSQGNTFVRFVHVSTQEQVIPVPENTSCIFRSSVHIYGFSVVFRDPCTNFRETDLSKWPFKRPSEYSVDYSMLGGGCCSDGVNTCFHSRIATVPSNPCLRAFRRTSSCFSSLLEFSVCAMGLWPVPPEFFVSPSAQVYENKGCGQAVQSQSCGRCLWLWLGNFYFLIPLRPGDLL